MHLKRQSIPFIRELLKGKPKAEIQEAEERFFQYLELSYRIYQREKQSLENKP